MKKRNFLSVAAAAPLGLFAGCGGNDSTGSANVRLLNASVGYDTLDLYWNSESAISSVGFATVSSFSELIAGTYYSTLYSAGGASQLSTASRTLTEDADYTIIAYGWSGSLTSTILTEATDPASSGYSTVRVLNLAPDAGTLDVYLTTESAELTESTATVSSAVKGTLSSATTLTSGTYRLRVTATGDTIDLRLDVARVTIASTGVYTFVLTSGPGGVLVNSLMLQQGGDLTAQPNTQARVRVMAGMAGGAKVTVLVGSTALTTDSTSPTITNYTLVDAGAVAINLSVDGQSLASQTVTLAAGSDTTFVVAGNGLNDAVVNAVNDVNRLPTTSTHYKMRLIHASPAYRSSGLTLTVNLEDLVSNIEFAQASSFSSRTATTDADLAVSSLSETTALYDVDSQSYLANGVYTVFVYDTSAGETTAKVKKDR